MPPTRDHLNVGPQLDTGVGSFVAPRPEIWANGVIVPASEDQGIGSPLAQGLDTLDSGNAFIPPLWL